MALIGASRSRDAVTLAALGIAARLAVVAWAAGRVPAVADGTYYDLLARRIAEGQGYTWLWPDGSATPAAHYPVGYPARVAGAYALFGARVEVAMIMNAALGGLGAAFVYGFAARSCSRAGALAAGGAYALHPALLFYVPALMTEGVTTSLVALCLWLASRLDLGSSPRAIARDGAWLGLAIGIATYLRPQNLALAAVLPAAAALAATGQSAWRRLRVAGLTVGVVLVAALAVLAPWTARNCATMGNCALVSVNGGWNLLIGTDRNARGMWAELKVPEACKDEFDEARKDACFGREARSIIALEPMGWAALAPAKVRATLDHFGAGPGYVNAANPSLLADRPKKVAIVVETAAHRILLALALLALARLWLGETGGRPDRAPKTGRDGPARPWSHLALLGAALVLAAWPQGAVGHIAFAVGALVLAARRSAGPALPSSVPIAGALVLVTAAVHAVFFGAGRYGLVVIPALAAVAPLAFARGCARCSSGAARPEEALHGRGAPAPSPEVG